jgi:filamentous hemagglutinin family protein
MSKRQTAAMPPRSRLSAPRLGAIAAALLLPAPALPQAPDARPQGGQVVAGQARISQTPARTQIDQSSQRAVVEWQRFDVGAQHQVDVRQPNAGAWSLQRVTGADPSAIAGRITSNGGVALVNPAGVMFHQGAQVDVAALIATTSDITNQNFMAGRMAFDGAPRPGARVENRGTITVREQGLAALVGPAVANSGTIRARLGRVALAGGAEAFALDLAGDGLLSLDVTRQVAATPGGGAALVTNTGRIEAEGGQVLLSATAASGLLETLVLAGGDIAAARVDLNAQGGGLRIEGQVAAQAAQGASLAATATGEVRVAAGAALRASGAGGRATIGAGPNSRIGAPERLAGSAVVERGARVVADGPGGRVILHSAGRTAHHGTLSAAGAGGAVEVSSRGALAVDGAMLAEQVLIDPVTLRIVAALSGSSEPAEVTAAAINATTGALTLQAEASIVVAAPVNKLLGPLTLHTTNANAAPGEGILIAQPMQVAGDLTLLSAGDIRQNAAGATIRAGTLFAESTRGAVRLDAGGNVIRALAGGGAATRFDLATTSTLAVDGAVTAPQLRLAPTQLLTLRAPLVASHTLTLEALRGVAQQITGAGITAGTLVLEAPLGSVRLTGTGNRIATLGDVLVPFGMTLDNAGALNLAGTLTGGQVTLTAATGDLTQDPAASRVSSPDLALFAPGGSVLFDGPANTIQALHGAARDDFVVDAGGALLLSAPVSGRMVSLRAIGEVAQDLGARVTAGELRVNAIGGAVTLDDPLNAIAALGESGAGGALVVATQGDLALLGRVVAPVVSLTAGGGIVQAPGSTLGTALLRITARGGDATLTQPGNAIAALGGSGASGDLLLVSAVPLGVRGALDAGRDLLLQAATLDIAAPLVARREMLLAADFGDVAQQAAGRLSAARLRAEAPIGTVRLEAAANALGAIAGRAGFEFRVATAGSPGIEGIVAPQVALAAGGDLLQQPGAAGIQADRLEAEAGGRIGLVASANAVPLLGRMVAPGGLAFTTSGGLTLSAPISVPSARLEAQGDLGQLPGGTLAAGTLQAVSHTGAIRLDAGGNALPRILGLEAATDITLTVGGAMALEGPLRAGDTMALQAEDSLTQATLGAPLSAARLEARSMSGAVALAGAGNAVAALGRGGAQSGFAFAHSGAAPLRLEGLVAAPSIELALPQGLAQGAGGALRTPLLRLEAGGGVALDGSGHVVQALGGRAASLTLASEAALEVVEALTIAGRLAMVAEALSFVAPVAAGDAALLATAGGIAQGAGGTLAIAGTLVARAEGAVLLAAPGNRVARLGAGSSGLDFHLATQGPLGVSGAVVSGAALVLAAGGEMRLDGAALTAGRGVLLAVPGGLSAGAPSSLSGFTPGLQPALVVDSRRAGGLATLPGFVGGDLTLGSSAAGPAGVVAVTQLAQFGAPKPAAGGPVVLDVATGLSPVFLLLDSAPVLGTLDVGRLGVLGVGGSAFLLGRVGGAGGAEAALRAAVHPAGAGPAYRLNTCPIGAPNCGAPPPAITTPATPLPPPEEPAPPPPTILAPLTPGLAPPALVAVGDALAPLLVPVTVVSPADLRAAGLEPPPPWQPAPLPWPLPPLLRPEEEQ